MALNEECSRAREWTSLELDSALSRFESAGLRRHLRACADCRGYAASVRSATALVRASALEARPTPVTLPAARRAGSNRAATRLGAVAALVASMAALVAGGLTTGGSQQSTSAGARASGSSDLSAMRAIRRQQLSVSSTTAGPRVRVVEID
jgi:predicted anti-sigma-YlaC factor YlaD